VKVYLDYTVLTTHTLAALLREKFKVDMGLITWAGIYFPAGCNGLVNAKLYFQAHQILPRTQEAWCHGNDGWWDSEMYVPVDASPLQCMLEAYANNTLFNHTITVAVEIMPFEMVPQWDTLILTSKKLVELLGGE